MSRPAEPPLDRAADYFPAPPDGVYRERRRESLPWAGDAAPVAAQLRVGNGGGAVALLRDRGRHLSVYQSARGISSLPAAWGEDERPIEIAFRGDYDALLIRGLHERGWELARTDGRPFVGTDLVEAGDPVGDTP